MRKGLFAICSVLLVLVVSIAALGPGCTPTTGTIEVEATLDGVAWPSSGTGAVTYTLTGPGATAPTVIDGTKVPDSFSGDAGNWTCAYVSGGPVGAQFVDITPDPTQEVSAGGTITFTLNFVTPTEVDASIVFDTWTINGTPVAPGFHMVGPGTVIDARYIEKVTGNNTGQEVKVKETLWCPYHWQGIEGEQAPAKSLHVVNAWGAVWGVPPFEQKLSQTATFNGQPVAPCSHVLCPWCEIVNLDLEIETVQKVGTTYTKNVNWIRFKPPADGLAQILDGGLDEVVFEDDNLPFTDGEKFTLNTYACIEVGEGFVDTNPDNDCCPMLPPEKELTIMYWAGTLL